MRNFAKLMLATSFILGVTGVARAWDDFAPPNDQQIAHIILTADKVEIQAAKQALQKSQNQQVQVYAKLLGKDHAAAAAVGVSLFRKIGVAPADNDISKDFLKNATEEMNKLNALNGVEFDKAFVASQISAHQQILQTIDQQLIPGAQNPQLKEFLQKFKVLETGHMQKAQELQGQIH